MMELDEPPKNKIRKLIFKHDCLLDTNEKLKIVGQLVGRTKKICEDDEMNKQAVILTKTELYNCYKNGIIQR